MSSGPIPGDRAGDDLAAQPVSTRHWRELKVLLVDDHPAYCLLMGAMLERLGLDGFSGIFDIVAADYMPKPDPAPYASFVKRHAVDPRRAVMVEDIARNLVPAAGLGMTTVWVTGSPDWAKAGSEDGHIHHATDDLAGWLETALKTPTAKAPDTPGGS